MVMEFMDHDLKSLMNDKSQMTRPFSVAEVKCLMLQLLNGIEYLHENWVIHRWGQHGGEKGAGAPAEWPIGRLPSNPFRRSSPPVEQRLVTGPALPVRFVDLPVSCL
jgi:hypothetical protein